MSPAAADGSATSPMVSSLVDAERGLHLLLNDDIKGARQCLEAQRETAYTVSGLAICEFLASAIGQEEERLSTSMEKLGNAERAAKKAKSTAQPDAGQWWTAPGLEFDVLLADVIAAQALLHLLGDNYVEYAKAAWKLNASFKYYTTLYKTVFVQDIKADASIPSIIATLNERFQAATVASSLQAASLSANKGGGAFARLRGLAPRGHASTTDLHTSSKAGSLTPIPAPASHPVSLGGSGSSSKRHSVDLPHPDGPTKSPAALAEQDALWTASPVMSFVVSGSAFGHGLFELVFALLPPKARKMFSWLGYGSGDRKKALKLLDMTARTGTDIHASFAALALVSYYIIILLSSGWQSDNAGLLASANDVVDREIARHPKGTLWLVNKAKLHRYAGNVDAGLDILRDSLSRVSNFRQAESTLQFELCWVLLSKCDYAGAAAAFYKMAELNSWSHSTYYALASGCWHCLPSRNAEQEKSMRDMYAKIQTSFNKKRFMGNPPSSEIYLEKRIRFYRAKTDRWIAKGKLERNAEWYESIKIPIVLELSLYWNQYSFYPKSSLISLTERLSALLDSGELDTPEEVALCHTILGSCATASADFTDARRHLQDAEDGAPTMGEAFTYLLALSKLYLAVLELREADATAGTDKAAWRNALEDAGEKIDEVMALDKYDMNGRVESRGQMLRVEIGEKKAALGL